MTFEVENRSGATIVRLSGDLTGRDEGKLVKAVAEMLDREGAKIVVDLAEVSVVSSAGLGDLVRLAAQANSQDGRFILANLTPFVADVIRNTQLNKFFDLAEDVDTALAQLGS
ncbi:MAG: STAS domain-containing protein [Planctomycetota bacterium]